MLIKNCKCFDGENFFDGLVNIYIENNVITNITSNAELPYMGDSFIDAAGKIVCPGFVDIHTHGIGGYDNSKLSQNDLADMTKMYNRAGTLVFYPSFPTISSKQMIKTLKLYQENMGVVPGIHLEGPYINIEKRGAQNPVYLQKPNKKRFEEQFFDYLDIIKRVTIAPELDEEFEFTDFLIESDIKVSFGHTVCSTEKASQFFERTGAIATHTFNAMPSIHHRSPSITTVALNRDNVYCEIIPDLIHIHPEIIKLIYKLKGPEKTIAVSDSMLATGLPEGDYKFSGLHVSVDKSGARLASGALAGSTITLADGIKHLIEIGIPVEHALMSATYTPSKAMGINNTTGCLKIGRKAELLILNDDFTISQVYKNEILQLKYS